MKYLLHKLFGNINRHGWFTFFAISFLATVVSTYGFTKDAQSFEWTMTLKGLLQSFKDLPSDGNYYLFLGKMLGTLALMSAAVSLFLRKWSYGQWISSIEDHPYTAIIGVGELEHNYIDDFDKNSIVIYNIDNKTSINILKENGFALKDVSISNIIDNINLKNIRACVINVGTDRDNINIAFEIISNYLNYSYNNNLRLIVRIENRALTSLFRTNAIFNSLEYKKSKIEIKTYSFFEECAAKLFQDHSIDGEDREIIDSNQEYSIIITGDGELAKKIIYEAAKIAHLPNENILNIYLLSTDSERFKASLFNDYTTIEAPTLKLHTKTINYNSHEFYTDDVWSCKNLTNVIVCYDDEDINLQIIASLQAKTYLRVEKLRTKILFGIFNQKTLASIISKDQIQYKNFFSFGNAKDILRKENIFDDKNNLLAKFINYTYEGLTDEGRFNPHKELSQHFVTINDSWFSKVYTDQLSSLAQAKHIKMKLKALNLKTLKSSKSKSELLYINRKTLENKFQNVYEGNYSFPNNFNDTLFDKMIRMEHNRWNAYHFLNGWDYKHYLNEKSLKNKMKTMKLHNCLLPIEEFRITQFSTDKSQNEQELMKLIEWDIYSFMYLPNYLAEAGFILEDENK